MDNTTPFGFADALDQAAFGLADSIVEGLSPAVNEALRDPIVRALMTADRVDRASLEGLLRKATAQLAGHHHGHHGHGHHKLCRAGGA